MIVKSEAGTPISIIKYNGVAALDRDGGVWERNYKLDESDRRGFCFVNVDTKGKFFLTLREMTRISKGPKSINTPTIVEELRDAAHDLSEQDRRKVDMWPDQKFREILIDAEEKSESPIEVMKKALGIREQADPTTEMPTGASPKPTEKQEAPRRHTSTARSRRQEGSVLVALEDISVLLTPKQLEFMERLSECPGWDGTPTGEYNASLYAQELEDTMNPMSVGAVLTTLREKNLLQTEKRRMGGVKCCIFKLTDLGVQVYNKLARR